MNRYFDDFNRFDPHIDNRAFIYSSDEDTDDDLELEFDSETLEDTDDEDID